jgi:hypothetical protein
MSYSYIIVGLTASGMHSARKCHTAYSSHSSSLSSSSSLSPVPALRTVRAAAKAEAKFPPSAAGVVLLGVSALGVEAEGDAPSSTWRSLATPAPRIDANKFTRAPSGCGKEDPPAGGAGGGGARFEGGAGGAVCMRESAYSEVIKADLNCLRGALPRPGIEGGAVMCRHYMNQRMPPSNVYQYRKLTRWWWWSTARRTRG